MASITIDIREVIKGMGKISSKMDNMSGLFKNIADLELSQTLLRFRKEEDPQGKKWRDPKTIRKDGSGGGGGYTREQSWNYVLVSNFHAVPPGWHWFSRSRGDKVLQDTGTLMRSIGRAYGNDYAIVGTNTTYAKNLQNGDFPFLGVNKQTETNINYALNAFMKGLLK